MLSSEKLSKTTTSNNCSRLFSFDEIARLSTSSLADCWAAKNWDLWGCKYGDHRIVQNRLFYSLLELVKSNLDCTIILLCCSRDYCPIHSTKEMPQISNALVNDWPLCFWYYHKWMCVALYHWMGATWHWDSLWIDCMSFVGSRHHDDCFPLQKQSNIACLTQCIRRLNSSLSLG